MDSKQIQILMLYIQTGLRVLSARLVLLMTLLMVFGLFCWCMYDPTYNRIGCVTLFALLVYLPVIKVDQKEGNSRAIINPNSEGVQNE